MKIAGIEWHNLYRKPGSARQDEIYKEIAWTMINEWIDDRYYIWGEKGWPSFQSIMKDFIKQQEEFAQIAREHNTNDRYFIIAKQMALNKLKDVFTSHVEPEEVNK